MTQLSPLKEYIEPLMDAWVLNLPRLPDRLRSTGALGRMLAREDTSAFQAGGAWVVVTGQDWMHMSANAIVLGQADPIVLRKAIKRAMDELGLQRLTATVPAPVADYFSQLRELGFRHEGRMTGATIYNDAPADLIILGFTPDAKKVRKRRRRSRRANG